ncbi:MAG: pathogenicity-like protein [Arenimonas sp.]
MRQVFTSPRLENVEGVAQLLRDAGVDIKVNDGRSYRKVSRREFSYVEQKRDTSSEPAIWVVNSDDYKRARELLHDAGLLETAAMPSYVPEALQLKDAAPASPEQRIFRIKLGLLVVLGSLVLLSLVRMFMHR